MDADDALWKATGVFAPDYPRQSSSKMTVQSRRNSRLELYDALESARGGEMPGYYSVYSFPRGHSRDGNIPKVDCIFIDLDVAGDEYDPKNGKTDFAAWRRDMSNLLTRARMIARAIIEEGRQDHFRVTLSGHKGLHLYLDFPTIVPSNGDFQQFKNGLRKYGEQVMQWLDSTAGGVNIEKWVDVDASDLGRLSRHPNTVHFGAEYDEKTRWCVPITMEELADLDVDSYLRLTRQPRWSAGLSRNPSESAGNKVVQSIRMAQSTSISRTGASTTFDSSSVAQYDEEANDNIELEDIPFLTSNKPCIKAFKERDDAFEYGNASHAMELSIISRFVSLNVPRDVIHEFFEQIPGYRESYTDKQINEVIGRQYKEFDCSTVIREAPDFCLGNRCSVYNRNDALQL
jgi:hypothetical protein